MTTATVPKTRDPKPKPPGRYPQAERVHAYARDVVAGRIVAGKLVRQACARHLADLEKSGTQSKRSASKGGSGLLWRPDKAEAALSFFEEVLCLEEDQPFKLVDFQAFIVGSLFGWYNAAGFRRFRQAYVEMGKGNGKTPLVAGAALYCLLIDQEASPEVYSAATAADQAEICFKDAVQMVRCSPELTKVVLLQAKSISQPARNAVMRPLSSEHRQLDGKRPHFAGIDELHEHPSRLVLDKITAGTKRRRNSLIFIITNSGSNLKGVCRQEHDAAVRMLAGHRRGDELFAYICTLDGPAETKEVLRRPELWLKVNPGLGTILPESYLRSQALAAREKPGMTNIVLRLNFCVWTQVATRWTDMTAWLGRCHKPALRLADFAGEPCWLAFDLASKIDLAALVCVFRLSEELQKKYGLPKRAAKREALGTNTGPAEAGNGAEMPAAPELRTRAEDAFAIFCKFYLPAATCDLEKNEHYQLWAAGGHLTKTAGARTDFHVIQDDVRALSQAHSVQRLSYDPREATYLVQEISAEVDFPCVEVTQSAAMLSQPMKELEALIAEGAIIHDGDPAMAWMMGNVVRKEARGGGSLKYYFPAKESDEQKIDGPVALIMALDGALRAPGLETGEAFVVALG
ncbi:MAG: terminase large subunit [Sphingomonadales bacterium]|nr:terminase large subunit [Sphingomonadales bacterium]